MYIKLPTNDVPLTLVADIVTYLGNDKVSISDIDKIQNYTGYGKTYVKSGITIAKMLELIDEEKSSDMFIVNNDVSKMLGTTPNDNIKNEVIRKYIQMYKPFVTFVEFCINDNIPLEAARKVYSLYNFCDKDFKFLYKLFISWGESTNIFSHKDSKINLSKDINDKYVRHVSEDLSLNDDMAIRIHIRERLGEETSNFIEESDMDELINALKKYKDEPRDSISASGRAFENFLRRISVKVSVDVTRKNGITQIINFIQSNNKIHSKQNSIGVGLGAIRNMSGHGIDPAEYEPWDLSAQSALAYTELVLSSMKSIYLYLEKNILIF